MCELHDKLMPSSRPMRLQPHRDGRGDELELVGEIADSVNRFCARPHASERRSTQ